MPQQLVVVRDAQVIFLHHGQISVACFSSPIFVLVKVKMSKNA